jgi:hypothetical protein
VADTHADAGGEALGVSGAGNALELSSRGRNLASGAASGADLSTAGNAALNELKAEVYHCLALHPGQLLLDTAYLEASSVPFH